MSGQLETRSVGGPRSAYRLSYALVAVIAFALLMLALPLRLDNYWLRVVTSVCMFGTIAQGLNVIVGFAGYHAFGNSVFFGVGAYLSAVLMTLGMPLYVALPAAVLGSVIAAALIGWPLLRLKGHYFAIATVVLNMAMIDAVVNIGGVTGGAAGLAVPMSDMPPRQFYILVYYMMLATTTVAVLLVYWLSKSSFGYAVRALRDSEDGAEVMGVNTTLMKVLAWAISAGLTGVAGAIWAYWINFIDPGSAFDINISVKAYVMMILGGMGTVLGPIIGAVLLETLSTLLWSQFSNVHVFILGALIVVVVMTIPEGLVFYLPRLKRKSGRKTA